MFNSKVEAVDALKKAHKHLRGKFRGSWDIRFSLEEKDPRFVIVRPEQYPAGFLDDASWKAWLFNWDSQVSAALEGSGFRCEEGFLVASE